MITENTKFLILEHLVACEAGLERIEKNLDEVNGSLSRMEVGVAEIHDKLEHQAVKPVLPEISP